MCFVVLISWVGSLIQICITKIKGEISTEERKLLIEADKNWKKEHQSSSIQNTPIPSGDIEISLHSLHDKNRHLDHRNLLRSLSNSSLHDSSSRSSKQEISQLKQKLQENSPLKLKRTERNLFEDQHHLSEKSRRDTKNRHHDRHHTPTESDTDTGFLDAKSRTLSTKGSGHSLDAAHTTKIIGFCFSNNLPFFFFFLM